MKILLLGTHARMLALLELQAQEHEALMKQVSDSIPEPDALQFTYPSAYYEEPKRFKHPNDNWRGRSKQFRNIK